jgi:hypothetical protein
MLNCSIRLEEVIWVVSVITVRSPALPRIRSRLVGSIQTPVTTAGRGIYFFEQAWREWMIDPLRDPNAAFLGFPPEVACKARPAV